MRRCFLAEADDAGVRLLARRSLHTTHQRAALCNMLVGLRAGMDLLYTPLASGIAVVDHRNIHPLGL